MSETEPVIEQKVVSNDQMVHLARVAFGRFLKPEIFVDDNPSFSGLDTAHKEWFNPSTIERSLFRPPADALLTVRIDPDNRRSPVISLNEVDFALIGRFPEKLAESAFRKTLAAGDRNQDRVAAAERSRLHAVESRQIVTVKQLTSMLERREELDLFAAKAKAAGWAHLTPSHMQELFNVCSQELITILDILHAREGWSDQERQQRYDGMIYYLTQGDQRSRVKHWQSTIGTVRRYLNARINTFENHYSSAAAWLSKQEYYEETEST